MRIYESNDIKAVWDRLNRKPLLRQSITGKVREIIAAVSKEGDLALFDYAKRFDGFELNAQNIRVTKREIDKAYTLVSDELIDTIKKSARNIAAFHQPQKRRGYELKEGGALTGRLVLPMRRAGVYVPGGKAAYPSSVLMNIIPAKIAGVKEVIMVTPPRKTGVVEPLTLIAADIAGADSILKIGGAQAIAALAYGTDSVPIADIITGPGNAYVTAAKREVFGKVGIDMLAGPSEVLIIADETANPVYVAADLLSQAEHDEMAASVLLTPCKELARKTALEIDRRLDSLPRRDIAKQSIDNFGTIVVTESVDEAFEISNAYAPEHLEIIVREPAKQLSKVANAGAVFLGSYSPETLGDYFAGTNHVLPTSGTARFSSPLSADSFTKTVNYVYYDKESLEKCRGDIERFARAEGLFAHAQSVSARFDMEEIL